MTNSSPRTDATGSTFHPFPRLPLELRLQIWQLSRPQEGPSLRTSCAYDDDDLLDALQALGSNRRIPPRPCFSPSTLSIIYRLPLAAQASHEARAAILHGYPYPVTTGPEGIQYWTIRPFDYARDVLCLEWSQLRSIMELYHMFEQGHPLAPSMAELLGGVRNVAIHEKSLTAKEKSWWERKAEESDVSRLLSAMDVVYIICDVPALLEECREIRVGEGGVWTWIAEKKEFDYTAGRDGENKSLDMAIQKLATACHEGGTKSAEIRELVFEKQH